MTNHLKIDEEEVNNATKVLSVVDFARRYRLESEEEKRLIKLLGPFASQQELLMNASRTPRFR